MAGQSQAHSASLNHGLRNHAMRDGTASTSAVDRPAVAPGKSTLYPATGQRKRSGRLDLIETSAPRNPGVASRHPSALGLQRVVPEVWTRSST